MCLLVSELESRCQTIKEHLEKTLPRNKINVYQNRIPTLQTCTSEQAGHTKCMSPGLKLGFQSTNHKRLEQEATSNKGIAIRNKEVPGLTTKEQEDTSSKRHRY